MAAPGTDRYSPPPRSGPPGAGAALRPPGVPGICIAAILLLSSCSVTQSITGLSARRYVEFQSRGLAINLVRDRSDAWGEWEDRGEGDFGLVAGRIDGTGECSLRLYSGGAAAEPAVIEGRLSDADRRLEGRYLAPEGGSPRDLVLTESGALAAGIYLDRAEADGSTGALDYRRPVLFRAVGLEPSSPARLRDWYRARFEGGESLDEQLEWRRDAFAASYRKVVEQGMKRDGDRSAPPWSYESRQFILFRSPSLLSIGTRASSYVGGIQGEVETSFAAIDTAAMRVLGVDDFLDGDWKDGLEPLLTAKLRRVLGLPPGASLVSAGFFGESLPPGTDIAIVSSGIAFYYRPGTIASAESGDIWIFLDWESLGPFLSPGVLERYGIPAGPASGGID
ncbi:MAG: hypothetical protein ACLQMF_09150 [Rectinemataceae bacterium]